MYRFELRPVHLYERVCFPLAMVAGSGAQMMKVEEDLQNHSRTILELDTRVQTLETLSTNGVLIWKLDKWGQKLSESKAGRNLSLDSPSFYTSKYGYHMRARVYPNGDGAGRDTHVSLFFVLCRGHFDELLPWPFKQKVTFMILDQESGTRHICDTFSPRSSVAELQEAIHRHESGFWLSALCFARTADRFTKAIRLQRYALC